MQVAQCLGQGVVHQHKNTPGWVLCNACILSGVLTKHDLPGAGELPEEAPRVVDDVGRHVDGLAVVALPQIEHGLEGAQEVVLHILWGEAEQPQVAAQSVQLTVPEHQRGALLDPRLHDSPRKSRPGSMYVVLDNPAA